MNIKEKLKNNFFRKGQVIGLEFSNGEIHIKEENSFNGPVKLKREDITFFSYSKKQPFVGIEFLGIRTRKGQFIYRSETMKKNLYLQMLEFLGVKRLKSIRKRIIIIQLLFASILFSLGGISHQKGLGNIHSLLFIFGAINVIGAIYNFISIRRQILDLLAFEKMK